MAENNLTKRVLFSIGRKITNEKPFKIGKFMVTTIPSASAGEYQGVLEYAENDEYRLNAIAEPSLILALTSLLLRTDMRFIRSDVFGASVKLDSFLQRTLPNSLTAEDRAVEDMTSSLKRAENLEDKVFQRFLRSCSLYQKGLRFMKDDPILGFFLFVSAIETMANTLIAGNGYQEKYKKFVYDYSPTELKQEQDKEFDELLEQAYTIRSKFTHAGTNYESPIGVADLLYMAKKQKYFTDHSKKPPEKIPSVYWFETVVHKVLMEFLARQKEANTEGQKLAEYAFSLGVVTTRAARAIETGERISLDDIRPD